MCRRATALNNNGLYLPLRPSRGNYYEAGLTKAIGTKVRLDASYFRRDIRNFADDDLLVNTGIGFPIAFHSARIRGVEAKLEILHLMEDLGIDEFRSHSRLFDTDVIELLDPENSIKVRSVIGGPAPGLVRERIKRLRR